MISVHLKIVVIMTCAVSNVQLCSVGVGTAEVQSSVVCDQGRFLCPDGETCCPMKNEMFGCCPFPDAVCCADEIHCVPHDDHCSISTDTFLLTMKPSAVHTLTEHQKPISCLH